MINWIKRAFRPRYFEQEHFGDYECKEDEKVITFIVRENISFFSYGKTGDNYYVTIYGLGYFLNLYVDEAGLETLKRELS